MPRKYMTIGSGSREVCTRRWKRIWRKP